MEWRVVVEATGDFADERVLGEGGSSVVYGGDDPETGAPWAVKLLRQYGAADGPQAAMADRAFDREIAVLARVRHPNVVPLLGHARAAGRRCLVYERMAHGSLDQCLAPGGPVFLGAAQRVRLLGGVMGGLLAMHASRPPLYHRDVKAANVGVTHGCVAKLLDCGLATARAARGRIRSAISLSDRKRKSACPGKITQSPACPG
jgi:interleukin-1 receptor-associated kinase 4